MKKIIKMEITLEKATYCITFHLKNGHKEWHCFKKRDEANMFISRATLNLEKE